MIGGCNKWINAYSKIIKRVGVERQGIREDLETASAMQRKRDMLKHNGHTNAKHCCTKSSPSFVPE